MKKLILLILVTTIIIGLMACGQVASGQMLQSDKPRDTSPAVNETDMAKLVEGNNAFAFDLYGVAVTIDRPFIFFIRDIPTGSTIFVGRVLNPVGK